MALCLRCVLSSIDGLFRVLVLHPNGKSFPLWVNPSENLVSWPRTYLIGMLGGQFELRDAFQDPKLVLFGGNLSLVDQSGPGAVHNKCMDEVIAPFDYSPTLFATGNWVLVHLDGSLPAHMCQPNFYMKRREGWEKEWRDKEQAALDALGPVIPDPPNGSGVSQQRSAPHGGYAMPMGFRPSIKLPHERGPIDWSKFKKVSASSSTPPAAAAAAAPSSAASAELNQQINNRLERVTKQSFRAVCQFFKQGRCGKTHCEFKHV